MKGRETFKTYAPIVVIIATSILAWSLGLHHYLTLEALQMHQKDLAQWTDDHFLISFISYVGIYSAVVTLSLPVAALMTLAGGVIFGQGCGTLGAVLSATLGSSLLFLSAKKASTQSLLSKTGSWITSMQKGFQDNAFFYLLTLRLIPIFPFVAVNLVAAFFQISFRTFFLGTFIGIIPGSFVYVSLGVALRDILQKPSPTIIVSPTILIALTGLGLLSLVPILYKRFHQNPKRHDTPDQQLSSNIKPHKSDKIP